MIPYSIGHWDRVIKKALSTASSRMNEVISELLITILVPDAYTWTECEPNILPTGSVLVFGKEPLALCEEPRNAIRLNTSSPFSLENPNICRFSHAASLQVAMESLCTRSNLSG